jgi:hypothetical protein
MMASTMIPAHCPSCGAVFQSRLLSISGDVKKLTLSGNKETCPFCGNMANTAEGVFDIANSVISVISAPKITNQMLQTLGAIVKTAYKEKSDPEVVAQEAEEIEPSLGKIIRTISKRKSLYLTGLLLIILTIKSCSLNISLDVNQLIDQLRGVAPNTITTEEVDISSK